MPINFYEINSPPIKNQSWTITGLNLFSQSNTKVFQNNPTIEVGDFKISIDGGGYNNLTNTPTANGIEVTIVLTANEMNGNKISVAYEDVAGAQWCSGSLFFLTRYLEVLPDSVTPPTVTDIDTQLTSTHGSGNWGQSTGTGSVVFDYYVRELDNVTGIPDVKVTVSANLDGTNVVASGYTDITGKATFNLDPGTYYFFSSKSGYNFSNPDSEVVS